MTERQSAGLRRVMDHLSAVPRSAVLDLGAASQGSIDNLAGPTCRLWAEDALRSLGDAVTSGQSAETWLAANVSYPAATFDAVLCWEIFGCAPAAFLAPLAARVHHVLKPAGRALAFLPASLAAARRPPGRYEILGSGLFRRRDAASAFTELRLLTRREIDKLFGRAFEVTDFFTLEAFHELLLVRHPSS